MHEEDVSNENTHTPSMQLRGKVQEKRTVFTETYTLISEFIRKVLLRAICILLMLTGGMMWLGVGLQSIWHENFKEATPPSSIQTFDDFLKWQKEIKFCNKVTIRGVSYYHVVGPYARNLPSGGALYVFDAKGNYIGWSEDCNDVMRNEGVFYPEFWLKKEYVVEPISAPGIVDEIASSTPGQAGT